MRKISKLHFITTNAGTAEQACLGGVRWVQLRIKDASYDVYKAEALKVQAICKLHGATFIINDNVALAKEIGADGVHIGKEDMSPAEARALLGNDFIIGCTANTAEEIKQLVQHPIDYIGLGPYKFTDTKKNLSPVLGLDGYDIILTHLNWKGVKTPPIIGIGGITEEDVPALMSTRLHGIAVSGAIATAGSVQHAAGRFIKLVHPGFPTGSAIEGLRAVVDIATIFTT
ncbi:MAG: thiamine phosphate synthase [Bacteroidota bacterium]